MAAGPTETTASDADVPPVSARPDDGRADVAKSRRAELGSFLKQRRAKLTPGDVGLSGGGRRHVRGLRRDEVAEAASIGVSWYAMLEQGRAENVTLETLDGVADALRLSVSERQYLRSLADSAFTRAAHDPRTPPEALLNFVRLFRSGGAFVHSSRCDIVAYNDFADDLFRFSQHGPEPNLLRVMLDEPSLRERFVEPTWDDIYDRMIGNFRRTRAQFGDASHEALIDELRERPEFQKRWQRHPIVPPPAEFGRIDHPSRGPIETSVIAFFSPSCPSYQIVLTLVRPREATHFADADAQVRTYSASLGAETIRSRREELGGFLRSRRERLAPSDVGLRAQSRRHVKGLRREEVALAAGIGTSWYALLEQGRVENVSARTLDAIADVLRLNVRERQYVRSLAARSFADLFELHAPPMPELLEFVRTFSGGHAHFHNGRFDMSAWNDAAEELYRFSQSATTNLLTMMATEPHMRDVYVEPDWLSTLQRMIAHFRYTSSRFGDASYAELVETLTAASPEFAKTWSELSVTEPGPTRATFRYGPHDVRELEFLALVPHASPEYTLIFKLTDVAARAPTADHAVASLAGSAAVGANASTTAASPPTSAAENQTLA